MNGIRDVCHSSIRFFLGAAAGFFILRCSSLACSSTVHATAGPHSREAIHNTVAHNYSDTPSSKSSKNASRNSGVLSSSQAVHHAADMTVMDMSTQFYTSSPLPSTSVWRSPAPTPCSAETMPVPAAAWDVLRWCESASDVSSLQAVTRNASRGCDSFFYDMLRSEPPLRECSSAELSAAISSAQRVGPREPLLVPGCRLQWWQGERACALIKEAGGLDMRGDSLMRHLQQAVIELLTGAIGDGASRHLGAASTICACDGAYDDGHAGRYPGGMFADNNKLCRENSVALLDLPAIRVTWPDYCAAWNDTQFLPVHAWDPNETYDPIRGGAVVVLQGGLHSTNLGADTVEHFFGAARLKPGARRHIFVNQEAPGENKARNFLSNFGLEPTKAYNVLVAAKAARSGAVLFDSFAATFQQESIDGQHYFHDTNIILAQLLLNILAAVVREPAVDSVSAVAAADAADAAASSIIVASTANGTADTF